MMHYHRYFSAARTEALTAYQATLIEIEANAEATRTREQALAEQQRDLDSERDELRFETRRAANGCCVVARTPRCRTSRRSACG